MRSLGIFFFWCLGLPLSGLSPALSCKQHIACKSMSQNFAAFIPHCPHVPTSIVICHSSPRGSEPEPTSFRVHLSLLTSHLLTAPACLALPLCVPPTTSICMWLLHGGPVAHRGVWIFDLDNRTKQADKRPSSLLALLFLSAQCCRSTDMLRRLASLGHQAPDDRDPPMSPSPGDEVPPQEPKSAGGLAGVFKGLAGGKLAKSPPPLPPGTSPERSEAPAPTHTMRGLLPDQTELFEQLKNGTTSERVAAANSLRYALADLPLIPVRFRTQSVTLVGWSSDSQVYRCSISGTQQRT